MNFLLYRIIDGAFQLIYFALLARVILSWIPHNPYHPIIQTLMNITEPILRPFQNLVPAHKIGLDISPILAFLALGVLRKLVFQLLL